MPAVAAGHDDMLPVRRDHVFGHRLHETDGPPVRQREDQSGPDTLLTFHGHRWLPTTLSAVK
jgi:hypothetical protein